MFSTRTPTGEQQKFQIFKVNYSLKVHSAHLKVTITNFAMR